MTVTVTASLYELIKRLAQEAGVSQAEAVAQR